MAYSNIPKVKRDGTIVLSDGAGNAMDVTYEEGNFTYDFAGDDEIVIRDRGSIGCVRRGDEQALSGSFSAYFREFTSADSGGVRDFVTQQGAYSGNTSTGATGTPRLDHYCISIKLEMDGGVDGYSVTNPAVILAKCVCKFSFSEGDPNAWNISFTAYGGVSYVAGT